MNVDVLKVIIKTIGQKLDNALSGIHGALAPNLSFSSIIERKGEPNVFVMNRMAMYFGTKPGDVTEYIHK